MASTTTQIVGAASAGSVATAINTAREVVAVKRPERAKESRQEADRVTMSTSSRPDQERSPAEPKRTEATYSKNAVKKR